MNIIERIRNIKIAANILKKDKISRTQEENKQLEEIINTIGLFDSYSRDISTTYDIIKKIDENITETNGIIDISGKENILNGLIFNDLIYNSEINAEEKFLVHCTNFFPNNHIIKSLYDGKKEYTSSINDYDGKHDVTYRHHRHTTHHVINGVVGNTSDGNVWENIKYIIVEPYKGHEQDFVSLSYSDSFTKESLVLSENAILLLNKNAISELTEEQKKEYNVVLFEGDFRNALRNYLTLNNIKMTKTDSNSANHAYSTNCLYEEILTLREKAINHHFNIIHDGSNLDKINIKDLVHIIDIYKMENYKISQYLFDEQNQIIDDELLMFLYASGFVKNDDNTYSLLPEETIYKRFTKDPRKVTISQSQINDLIEIKNDYIKTAKEKEEINQLHEEGLKENEILNTKVKDISNTINIEYIKSINENLKQLFRNNEIMPKCNMNSLLITYMTDEYIDFISSIPEYNPNNDLIEIKFDENETLINNIKNSLKRLNEIDKLIKDYIISLNAQNDNIQEITH